MGARHRSSIVTRRSLGFSPPTYPWCPIAPGLVCSSGSTASLPRRGIMRGIGRADSRRRQSASRGAFRAALRTATGVSRYPQLGLSGFVTFKSNVCLARQAAGNLPVGNRPNSDDGSDCNAISLGLNQCSPQVGRHIAHREGLGSRSVLFLSATKLWPPSPRYISNKPTASNSRGKFLTP